MLPNHPKRTSSSHSGNFVSANIRYVEVEGDVDDVTGRSLDQVGLEVWHLFGNSAMVEKRYFRQTASLRTKLPPAAVMTAIY